ncbi:MAG TPA: hypothetical protein VF546_22580 [Pyrinomonadaceae bacterium]|jgi:hypothetical protein
MLDNEARTALATELLNEIFTRWAASGKPWQLFHEVFIAKDAPPIAVYANRSTEGYGDFACQYWPLAPVEKIITSCEQIFDSVIFEAQFKDETEVISFSETEWEPGFRERAIREMASFATHAFILGMRSRIIDAVQESFEDSLFLAEAGLTNDIAVDNDADTGAKLGADVRPLLDQMADKAAKRRRETLVGLLGALPRIITKGRSGRPRGTTKSAEMRQQEKEEFVAQIEVAVRTLALAASKLPSKTAVARELRMGGVNPSKGNDTSLQTFNNRLNRYGIDYDQIVFKVMRDLPLNK